MTKTCCDICRKEMPTSMLGSLKDFNFCISSHGIIWDICDDCRHELNVFINNKRKDSKDE